MVGPAGPLRVIIAARLSQELGKTGIDTQDIQTRRWAELQGHAVVDVVADRKSGTVPPWKRKNLRPWVTDPAKLVLYDAVVGYRLDRLTRGDNKSTNEIEQWAWDHGKQLLTTDGLFFPCEGKDAIPWDIAKRLAHNEWLDTSERYRRMQRYLQDNGWLVGKPPFGYRITGVDCGESPCTCKNDRKALEPDPVDAETVWRMVAFYFEGLSWSAICRALDAQRRRSPTGRGWAVQTVGRILRRETLIGRRRDANGRIVLRFDPILDMETWGRLQARLDANARRHGAIRAEPAPLTGAAYCLKCRGIMHYRITRPGGTLYTYYRCDGLKERPSRCRNMIPAAELEAEVRRRIATLTDVERVTETLVRGADPQEELDRLRDEADRLDPFDPADDARRAELREQADEVRLSGRSEDELRRVFTGVSVADYFAGLDPQEQRAMLLEDGVRVYAAKIDGELACELEAASEAYLALTRQVSPAELSAWEAAFRGDRA